MSRPTGARNHDFDEKRAALLDRLTDFALSADLRRPSLRQFAQAMQVSEPTLRHYFGDRQGLVTEILTTIGKRGAPLWEIVAQPSDSPAAAFEEYFRISEAGMRLGGFIRAHAFGLIEGLADETIGRAYLENVLEPALRSVTDKLRATPGMTQDEDEIRAAAFTALSPLLVISLHQDLLGGRMSAPLEISQVMRVLQGWLARALTPGEVTRPQEPA